MNANYLRPDIYVEKISSTTLTTTSYAAVASTLVVLGNFPRGLVGVPLLANNWTEFCNAIAHGLDSPFMTTGYAPNSVYGFFQNGGSRVYVIRLVGPDAKKATGTIAGGAIINAYDEGAWGNEISVIIDSIVLEGNTTRTVTISYKGDVVETFSDTFVTAEEDPTVLINKVNNNSLLINISAGALVDGNVTLATGKDDLGSIVDQDYLGAKGLKILDNIEDFGLIAIPGVTSKIVLQGLVDYCDNRKNCYPILDLPQGSNASSTITTRVGVTGAKGAFYYPWLKITDPTSAIGSTKLVPPCGHVAGIYARTDSSRSIAKAPAGINANILGILGTDMSFSDADVGALNDNHVNVILTKPGRGTVVWGARNISTESDSYYVTDVRLDMDIELSCYSALEWALFEPANINLCGSVALSLTDVLQERYQRGELKGSTVSEAYYVKCDGELNPDSSLAQGMVVAEIGYAKSKPNEFTVLRIKQMVSAG